MSAWMPIETAPRGRGSILVFRADNLCTFCAVWDEIHNTWIHFGGSWEPIGGEITHWMPLPRDPIVRLPGNGFTIWTRGMGE